MTFSQNALFAGSVVEDAEYPHPPGRTLARDLAEVVRAAGWAVLEIDNWRDSGWSIVCRRDSSEVEIPLTQIPDGRWILQISPARVPGLFARWRGRGPSATRDDVFQLATASHEFIAAHFSDLRWLWDGFPEGEDATPEPVPWRGAG